MRFCEIRNLWVDPFRYLGYRLGYYFRQYFRHYLGYYFRHCYRHKRLLLWLYRNLWLRRLYINRVTEWMHIDGFLFHRIPFTFEM